jgi:hypothetical protein
MSVFEKKIKGFKLWKWLSFCPLDKYISNRYFLELRST